MAHTDDSPSWPRRLTITAAVVFGFVIFDQLQPWLYARFDVQWDRGDLLQRLVYVYAWYLIPALVVAAIAAGPARALSALGLAANPLTALLVALLCTAFMGIGYGLFGEVARDALAVEPLTRGAIYPGFFEEVLYRGMLFGLLFRYAGWGFVPAALLGAVWFGIAHFYQGDGVAEALAIAAFTGVGAVWFAWLYVRWGHNLWVPIFFHILMNGWWAVFDIDETALGGGVANIFRTATIIGSIILTLFVMRRRGIPSPLKGRVWHQR